MKEYCILEDGDAIKAGDEFIRDTEWITVEQKDIDNLGPGKVWKVGYLPVRRSIRGLAIK